MRRDDSPLSPGAYWLLLAWSPAVMLVGMAAGAVLIIRSILVWGVGSDEYQFGVDIPMSAGMLVVWVGGCGADATATPEGCSRSGRALSIRRGCWCGRWADGSGCGTCSQLPSAASWPRSHPSPSRPPSGSSLGIPVNLWIALPFALALTLLGVGCWWCSSYAALCTVSNWTPTHLIAPRLSLEPGISRGTRSCPSTPWPSSSGPARCFGMLMNRDVEHTFCNYPWQAGGNRSYSPRNSHEADVNAGADMIPSMAMPPTQD